MRLRTPGFWYDTTPSARLREQALAPLSGLYALGSALSHLRPAPAPGPVPVICIGNFIAGGAGKTPVALAMMDLIRTRELAKRPCFLTRGYGGAVRGPVTVDLSAHTAHDVGDEALLLARVAPAIVARCRGDGARHAAQSGHDLIVMDDGLLNRSIHKNISIAVVDGRMGIGNGAILPAGPLRAPLHVAMKSTDAILMVGDDQTGFLTRAPEAVPRFSITLAPVVPAQPAPSYIGFCGIGYPQKFRDSLAQAGLQVRDVIAFPDHHAYTAADMAKLNDIARKAAARLITTTKDAVKITSALAPADSFDILDLRAIWPAGMDEALSRWLREELS